MMLYLLLISRKLKGPNSSSTDAEVSTSRLFGPGTVSWLCWCPVVTGSEYDSDENMDLDERDDILEQEAGDADDVGPEEDLRNQVHRVHLWVALSIYHKHFNYAAIYLIISLAHCICMNLRGKFWYTISVYSELIHLCIRMDLGCKTAVFSAVPKDFFNPLHNQWLSLPLRCVLENKREHLQSLFNAVDVTFSLHLRLINKQHCDGHFMVLFPGQPR